MDHTRLRKNNSGIDCLVKNYVVLEKEIQHRIRLISESYCKTCSTKCCKEVMCREAIESRFLRLIGKQNPLEYDRRSGFLSPCGCRLKIGRPLVCYEFFCTQILNDPVFKASNIQRLIKEFVSIGNKAHGNTHLVCIEDLNKLSNTKKAKIELKIERLTSELEAGK